MRKHFPEEMKHTLQTPWAGLALSHHHFNVVLVLYIVQLCQHQRRVVGNHDGVLMLCHKASVVTHHGPSIGCGFGVRGGSGNKRLNSNH